MNEVEIVVGKRPETEEERAIQKEKEHTERYRKIRKRPETETERAIRKEKEWVAFKIFFYLSEISSDPYEIQKIFVPKDRSTSWCYLKEKIRRNFGEKLPYGMKIFWVGN